MDRGDVEIERARSIEAAERETSRAASGDGESPCFCRRGSRDHQPITRDLALHLRNIAALLDANVAAVRFDEEVRTLLIVYGGAALRALSMEDVVDDPRGAVALRRYSRLCPGCHYDLEISRGAHSPSCDLGASS